MLWPNPTQSSRGTDSEVRSRAASQAPAQDQFNHLPNPIGYLLNQFKHLLNQFNHLPNPLSYLPNRFKHLPNQFKHLPNPIGYLPNLLQQPPEFIVVQLELMPNQLNQLPKSSSRQFSGCFLVLCIIKT